AIYDGKATTPLSMTLRTLFLHPSGLNDVEYAILDPLARNFAPKVVPGMQDYIAEIETWPLVFQSGALSVYRAP
nr:hypothetical protein [Longilinea sp.]